MSAVEDTPTTVKGGEYAIKKVRLLNLKEKEKDNALNEVKILSAIK